MSRVKGHRTLGSQCKCQVLCLAQVEVDTKWILASLLFHLLQLEGREASRDILAILAEVDKDGDGEIDYDEFVDMMLKGNDDVLFSKPSKITRRVELPIPETE